MNTPTIDARGGAPMYNLHVRLDADVHDALRRKAFTERHTIQDIVNEALRVQLGQYIVTSA